MHTIQKSDAGLTTRTVQRQLAALLPECRPAGAGDSTLEIAGQGMDAPRLISATMLEAGPLSRRLVPGAPAPGFRAFLDGTQRSDVISYVGGIPLVLGHAAAVIRERRDGRFFTWGAPLSTTRLYGPRTMLTRAAWTTLADAFGDALVDTSDRDADVMSHPLALRDAAIHRVQGHREALEWRLAEAWCQGGGRPTLHRWRHQRQRGRRRIIRHHRRREEPSDALCRGRRARRGAIPRPSRTIECVPCHLA
ncbi:MAG: hypothetical protein ABIV10_06590, partial [Gemmatimonadaceae bacterium]